MNKSLIKEDKPSKQEVALQKELTAMEEFAMSIVVENEEDYGKAAEFGRLVKEKTAQVKEFFAPMKQTAHEAHKQICNKEKSMLQPLSNVEKILKETMGGYVLKKEQEKARQQEEARLNALKEAERLEQESANAEANEKFELAQEAALEALVLRDYANSLVVETDEPKVQGVSHKKDWEIESIEYDKVPVFAEGVELRPVNESAVLRLIRASKGTVKIDGVTYKETIATSFRR